MSHFIEYHDGFTICVDGDGFVRFCVDTLDGAVEAPLWLSHTKGRRTLQAMIEHLTNLRDNYCIHSEQDRPQ